MAGRMAKRARGYFTLDDPTVGEKLHWAYANLAKATAALQDGVDSYKPKHWSILHSMYRDLRSGAKNVRPIADDIGHQILSKPQCSYCGASRALSRDHIIARYSGGEHKGDNLIVACRSCNSSKGSRDLMEWYAAHDEFPSMSVLQRYLKLAIDIATGSRKMDMSCRRVRGLPFSIRYVPEEFPPLNNLTL